MAESKQTINDPRFTRVGDNITGELPIGVKVGEDVLRRFEMRPADAGDMFDAEKHAAPDQILAYRGALMSQQLVRLGDLSGPIDFDIIRRLKPADYARLVDALEEVEVPGKPESNGSEDGTSGSSSSA